MTETNLVPRYGEVYYVLPVKTVGSEQRAGRPAVIISNDTNNRFAPTVEVVYLTRQEKNAQPTHVYVAQHENIDASTTICEQINTVSKLRLADKLGELPQAIIPALKKACAVSINITVEDLLDAGKGLVPREQYEELLNKCTCLETEASQRSVTIGSLQEQLENLRTSNIKLAAERQVFEQLYADCLKNK